MARVKYYDQALKEWKYADAALNMKGKDGHTPVKGEDYFTDEDVEKIIEDVLEQGVLTYNEQELTEEQKAQARENIGIDQISFNKLTEDLDADGFRITNLPLPQSGSEPATKEFVENFTIEGSTYVATDDGEGNVTIRPYLADEDELVFKSHIQNQKNPHMVTAEQVKARPNTWIPTATEVGATPASHATNKSNPHGVTAAQVGARPDTWTPTAEEVGARPDTWTPTAEEVGAATLQDVNTAKGEANAYTDQQVKKATSQNLLVNSIFVNPVNQRGGTNYTAAGYSIDRWQMRDAGSSMTVLDGAIRLENPLADTINITNYLDDRVVLNVGDPITLSILDADGNLYTRSGNVVHGTASAQVGYDAGSAYYVNTNNWVVVGIYTQRNFSIVGIKLERGNTQTLAHQNKDGKWVLNEIPDYNEQLLKCQKTLQRFRTSNLRSDYCEDYRPTMRMTTEGKVSKFERTVDGVTYYFASAEKG